ncbi:redoxin domain-containing protein [Arcicella sp. LKC2W]|uniref:redoxin domain-containing protein n=1 Tax=Arcicella sp. LKC2W TaxID=2984198 RepID=UPI002B1F1CB2|nr:redoxin domain-containing protein [Arcicella sp. LKC2W]MEA5461077.1 redoxin domain-containing protein [Arcicella sp. LKC2W]
MMNFLKPNFLIGKIFLFLLFVSLNIFATDVKTLEIGASAPDFSLRGTDGKTYSLNSFSDAKILAIVFTCNHCPTAQAYEDRMIALANDYKAKGVTLITVSPNDPKAIALDELGYSDMSDTYEEMKIRVKEKGYTFPYLYDGETQKMSRAYGPIATPHLFIFDKNRKLQYVGRLDGSEKIGSANAEDARNAFDALLAGNPIATPVTKTFGCSTKWSEKSEWAVKAPLEWAKEPVNMELIDDKGIAELLANKTDKIRLINVWATWCGPCVTEMPEFVTINRMYRRRDFEFITISADKPAKKDKAQELLKKMQASGKNYTYNSEDKYKLIEAIDPKWQGALPYTLLIAPNGKILYRTQGAIVPQEMKRMIVEQVGRVY